MGCGTGLLTDAICRHADPGSVVGCGPAEPLIEYARSQSRDARASFVGAGAGELPSRPGGYGSVTSLLALDFFPDPGPDGTIALAARPWAVRGTVDHRDGMNA